jgi:uncharacterized repeat protein (TIGR01451 family)
VTFRASDLEVVKSADPSPLVPGEGVTYSLKVTNHGPDTATNVKVTDALPAGVSFASASSGCTEANKTVTFTLASLANGGSHTVTVTADVASSADSLAPATTEVERLHQALEALRGLDRE